jgi:hypothetical protein
MKPLGGYLSPLRGFVIQEIKFLGLLPNSTIWVAPLPKPLRNMSFAKKTLEAPGGLKKIESQERGESSSLEPGAFPAEEYQT